MNEKQFLEWCDEQDEYWIEDAIVRDKWPKFYEEYDLAGVTMKMEDGKQMVPVRDYEHAVRFGRPID